MMGYVVKVLLALLLNPRTNCECVRVVTNKLVMTVSR